MELQGDAALEFAAFDKEYVARLAAGDPETEAHFGIYFGRFLSLKLRARRLSAEMSDDIRQETLYRVLKTLRQGKGIQDPTRFGAFVNSVCNNVLLEFVHKTSRASTLGDEVPEVEDTAIRADESLITAERKKAVAGILKDLSAKDREILRLVFFEDLAREEICRRLHTDAGYVRVLLHRAKARFEAAFVKSYRSFAGLIVLLCNVGALTNTIRQILIQSGDGA
ncbi:MAG TPA: sigma-70 family RNA polymerase sigma factor [Bryobacteraceae bacterium]|jgi:RNA polymerase sigma-70 factor (ECF subfamily)|nr:sigma-70 family RNA polymerase sigma factor [Bryobacteraceae bacterium]